MNHFVYFYYYDAANGLVFSRRSFNYRHVAIFVVRSLSASSAG
jgi:hypothetical protein